MPITDSHYITGNQTFKEALRNLQQRGELMYTPFSDGWIIRLERKGKTQFIHGYTFGLNTQSSANIANDKVATYQLLADRNIPAVQHSLLNSPLAPEPDPAVLESPFTNGAVVVKPTYGSRGREVAKCTNPQQVLDIVHAHTDINTWSASPFIDIQKEVRLAILGQNIGIAYEKQNPQIINGLKMFNLNLGTTAIRLDPMTIDPIVVSMAQNAMQAIGLTLGAVDIVFDNENKPYVLEINSGFSLEHYASLAPECRQEVVAFYENIALACFNEAIIE